MELEVGGSDGLWAWGMSGKLRKSSVLKPEVKWTGLNGGRGTGRKTKMNQEG